MTLTRDEIAAETEKMMTPELQAIGAAIQQFLPEGWGFGCIVFQFTEEDGGPLLWVSNGQRADMMRAMQEFIDKRGGPG